MKKLLGKLYSRRGESLIETLCAILIMALSAAMFVSMARSAVEINRKTTQATEALYAAITVAEEQAEGEGADEIEAVTVTVTYPYATLSDVKPPVYVWGAPDTLRSYSLQKKGATP